MAITTQNPEVVRVSQKGQATIPKTLREKFGIETPGEVFVYEEGSRIVIEPIPTGEALHGIHAGDRPTGEITEKIREHKSEEIRREETRADRLRPSESE